MFRKRTLLCFVMLLTLVLVWWHWSQPPPATASPQVSITVNSLADEMLTDGNCTLREAIFAANTNTAVDGCPAGELIDADTITFSVDGTINLTHPFGELIITQALIIEGNGRDQTIIDGLDANRIFNISNGRGVTLRHLTLQNGYADGANLEMGGAIMSDEVPLFLEDVLIQDSVAEGPLVPGGGAIASSGDLTVMDSLIRNNSADGGNNGGGAILAQNARVLVQASTIQNNSADDSAGGGGIHMINGVLTVTVSLIEENQSVDSLLGGGGIYAYDSDVFIFTSSIQNNRADGSELGGGGLLADTTDAFTVINSSTFDGNSADSSLMGGGGAVFGGGFWAIFNSTISRNTADQSIGGGGLFIAFSGEAMIGTNTISNNRADNAVTGGGGLLVNGGMANLVDTTIAFNSAESGPGSHPPGSAPTGLGGDNGGGVESSGNGLIDFQNTIIGMNSPVDCYTPSASYFTSYGHNLDSDNSCLFMEAGDVPGVDPLLGPLQDNGGNTETHLPMMGSPAVDAGDCIPGTSDQRGMLRPYGDACDIGSVETRYSWLYLPVILNTP